MKRKRDLPFIIGVATFLHQLLTDVLSFQFRRIRYGFVVDNVELVNDRTWVAAA